MRWAEREPLGRRLLAPLLGPHWAAGAGAAAPRGAGLSARASLLPRVLRPQTEERLVGARVTPSGSRLGGCLLFRYAESKKLINLIY